MEYFPSAALTTVWAPVLSVVICRTVRGNGSFPRRPQDLHGEAHQRLGDPVLCGQRGTRYAGPKQRAAAEHPVQRTPGRLELDVQRRCALRGTQRGGYDDPLDFTGSLKDGVQLGISIPF